MLKQTFLALVTAAAVAAATAALADPPAHAPAHGWRKKNDPYYVGYSGKQWERDYDISAGHCDREAIGAVIGGVAGGAIGSRVGGEENRAVATIVGAIAGAFIGARIGRELDEADRGCFGHALEIGKPGGRVTWANSASGVSYVLIPGEPTKVGGKPCRTFVLSASRNGKQEKRRGTACQAGPGSWDIRE
jgi:surface antigen